MGTPAAILKTTEALGLISTPLFAQGRAGNAAAPADKSGIAALLVHLHPQQPG
jgi:hypothetical protein